MTNALRYTEDMKKAGLSETQSIAVTQMMFEHVQQMCASKTDLDSAMTRIDHRFELMDLRFNSFEEKMDDRFDGLENRMIIKLAAVMAAFLGIFGVLLSLLIYLR